jgi:hypothetical protein
MNNPYAIFLIVISLIIFGITSLIIFKKVRKNHHDFVKSVAKNSWYGQNVDFLKYYQSYKLYYSENGWDLVLILNIISYPTFIIGAIYDLFS